MRTTKYRFSDYRAYVVQAIIDVINIVAGFKIRVMLDIAGMEAIQRDHAQHY